MEDGDSANERDLRAMQQLAAEVWALDRRILNSGASVGELAWAWGADHRLHSGSWGIRIWYDRGRAAAWGWIFPPEMMRVAEDRWEMGDTTLMWQVHPQQPQLLDEVLDWFKSSAEHGATRYTTTRAANSEAVARLDRVGYIHEPGAPWFLLNTRTLEGLDTAPLPPGFTLRTAREVDATRAVAVHRAVWAPSQFTANSLSDVRATWPYRDDLAVFVEDAQGMLVASALVWYDETNRTAELEPVGTDPNHRRHGLGRAVSMFGLSQARGVGALEAIVSCRGDEDYTISKGLYRSLGFREVTRDLVFKSQDGS